MSPSIEKYFFATPVSYMVAEASDAGLKSLHFYKGKTSSKENSITRHPILISTRSQVLEYFNGKRKTFDIPLDWSGATDFYKEVWKILVAIPFGKTRSYGDIARQLGDINKARAVGLANGRNPIALIVPCHRVIGSDGSLTGYAGGIDIKLSLLQIENPGHWVEQVKLF